MSRIRIQAPNTYNHIFNRGMQKQPIFIGTSDYIRFTFLLLTFQGKQTVSNVSRVIKENVQGQTLNIEPLFIDDILKERLVELVAFTLMPNHFHLILKEVVDDGIAKYMQRVITAYTMYFNIRYEKSGHLLQGPYRSIFIENDRQLMHLSAYIHKNPNEIKKWKGMADKYPWSSFQDYIGENRWGKLLETSIVSDRYKNHNDQVKKNRKMMSYKDFVETSPAKELVEYTDNI